MLGSLDAPGTPKTSEGQPRALQINQDRPRIALKPLVPSNPPPLPGHIDIGGGDDGGCFQTPKPRQRIGNITISTVSKGHRMAVLRPICDNGSLRTPLKRVMGNNFATPIQRLDDKENCPLGLLHMMSHCGAALAKNSVLARVMGTEDRMLNSSPVVLDDHLGLQEEDVYHLEDPADPVDWDALASLVKLSSALTSRTATPQPVRRAASKAFERVKGQEASPCPSPNSTALEDILFSQDPAVGSDIFLGYDQNADVDDFFQLPRPRASSMVSVQSAKKSNIEIKVCADKRRLPTLRGSNLKKMVIPAAAPAPKRNREQPIDEYKDFISKFVADEPVESEASDDDFDEAVEDDGDDDSKTLTSIPKHEIEGLFDNCHDIMLDRVLPVRGPPLTEEMLKVACETSKTQVNQHLQLLVQILGLCGEIQGAEQYSVVLMKLLSQFRAELDTEPCAKLGLFPVRLKNFDLLLQGIPDVVLRRQLSIVSKDDPMIRPRSTIKSIHPVIFKNRTREDPYNTSKAFDNLLALFQVRPDRKVAWNPAAEDLVDNRNDPYSGKRLDCFLQSEDRLLLVGLARFGLGNWETIQARFLPTRTTRQIHVRYKNLIARRAKPNPIKDFIRELEKPLSSREEALIYRGVQRFGKDFRLISQHFLPHRPPTILRSLWNRLDEARRQSIGPPVEISEQSARPASSESDAIDDEDA